MSKLFEGFETEMLKDDDARKDYERAYVPEGSTEQKEDEDIEAQHREEDKEKFADWMEDVYNLLFKNRPSDKGVNYAKVVADRPGQYLSIDLMDYSRLVKENAGYAYCLVAVDVYTRKIYCHLLKEKSIPFIKAAFIDLINNGMPIPEYVWSDHESAVWSREMKDVFETYGILPYYTANHSVFAEIAIKKIKEILTPYMAKYKTKRWYTIIDKTIDHLNKSEIKTVGLSPNEMTKPENDAIVKESFKIPTVTLSKREKFFKDHVKVGDKVLVVINPSPFRKGTDTKWHEEVAVITKKMMHGQVPMFQVDTFKEKSFYSHQLMPVLVDPIGRLHQRKIQ